MPDACPHCHTPLIGDPIPAHHRHLFGHATHFRREIAVHRLETGRVEYFACPDCSGRIERTDDA